MLKCPFKKKVVIDYEYYKCSSDVSKKEITTTFGECDGYECPFCGGSYGKDGSLRYVCERVGDE